MDIPSIARDRLSSAVDWPIWIVTILHTLPLAYAFAVCYGFQFDTR